jgi:methionyl-tRNA formyltransferase
MSRLRLIFMGTPDFAVPILDGLIEAGHEIVCVMSQPARPAGRGQRERPSPVQAFAEDRRLPVHTPKSLKAPEEQARFAALGADAAVVAAYGLILPKPILGAPRLGCINVHASLLPRWRGAAPIQHAILAGDSQTGISIMQMDEGLDTGPVLFTGAVPITAETTAGSLHDALAVLGCRLVVEALDGLAGGSLAAQPQAVEGVTYATKLGPDAGRLDWTRPAPELDCMIRAFSPWPGTWFEHSGQRIKVLAARIAPGTANSAPGSVLDGAPTIACGSGALQLLRLQRPGKGAMDAPDFLRGYALASGTLLE